MDINRNVAATLNLCGPAILNSENVLTQFTHILSTLINKQHPCQMDLDADVDEEFGPEESSESDWLVIDTAFDAITGLSTALGPTFGELWKIFEKTVMKYGSSQENIERSTAIGVIADCTSAMGAAVSPYTLTLLKLLLHRLGDEDPETRSNAAYGIGLLIFNSTDSSAYLSSYNSILSKLEPLLHTQEARLIDNSAGCVCRMIMKHPDRVPVSEVVPVLLELLPLKEDYEENKPVFECLVGLCEFIA
jgi:hypothetical protein